MENSSLWCFMSAVARLMLCFSCPSFQIELGKGKGAEHDPHPSIGVREDMPADRVRGFGELPQLISHPGISHPPAPRRYRVSCWQVRKPYLFGASAQGVLISAKGVGTEVCTLITHTCMEELGLLKSHAICELFGYA